MTVFLLSILVWGGFGGLAVESSPLKRNQLPDGFPLQVLDSGFAVIRVRIDNGSSQPWGLDPSTFRLSSPKKKRLKRARPTDIAPKLRKFYAGNRKGIHGEAYGGYRRPTPVELGQAPTIDPNQPPGTLPADLGTQLRQLLEGFELQPSTLQPGQAVEGLLYYKSKDSGARLYNGELTLEDGTKVALQPLS